MNVDKKNELHKNLNENTKMLHVMMLLLVCLFGTILCWQMLLSDKYFVTNLIGTVLQTTSYQLPGLFMIGWNASYGMAQITSILLFKRKAFLTKSTPNRSSAHDKNEIAQLDRLNGSSCAVRSFSDDYVDDFAAQILQDRQFFDSKCIKVQHHLTIAASSKPSRIRSTLYTILAALSVLLTWHITIRVVLREARLIIQAFSTGIEHKTSGQSDLRSQHSLFVWMLWLFVKFLFHLFRVCHRVIGSTLAVFSSGLLCESSKMMVFGNYFGFWGFDDDSGWCWGQHSFLSTLAGIFNLVFGIGGSFTPVATVAIDTISIIYLFCSVVIRLCIRSKLIPVLSGDRSIADPHIEYSLSHFIIVISIFALSICSALPVCCWMVGLGPIDKRFWYGSGSSQLLPLPSMKREGNRIISETDGEASDSVVIHIYNLFFIFVSIYYVLYHGVVYARHLCSRCGRTKFGTVWSISAISSFLSNE